MNGLMTGGNFIRHWVFGHRARQLFLNGLRSEIRTRLNKNPSPMIREIREEARRIQSCDEKLIEDAPSRGHLELTSHIVTAYRVLLPEVGAQKATIQLLERAMMEGVDTMSMSFSLKSMLTSSRNNPDRLYNIFRWLMKQYGTTFKWRAPHEHGKEGGSFSIEIQRCFYHSFFTAHNAPFLTPVLCQIDSIWFNMIDPQKHGFSFDTSRYRSQGYGAPKCIFPIVEAVKKKQKKD
ncbi:MAG: L-2-amino-thiazoline-4-carboxylic acid hydrolase [Thermodesulfobacteriota bacterium]